MSKKRTAALGAGVLSALLAGGVTVAPAASAEPEDSAYALQAEGLVTIPKTPYVVDEGKEHLVAADLPPEAGELLHTGVFNAYTSEGHAKATTTGLEAGLLDLLPEISASMVVAECTDGKGSTSVTDLKVAGQEVNLDQIQPNQEIIPEPLAGIARLTLNKQEKDANGMLKVSALSVELVNGAQSVDMSVAVCGEKPENGDDGDKGDNGDNGDRPDENGKAPVPSPQPGHLDVTG